MKRMAEISGAAAARELVSRRRFRANPERLFAAFRDPDLLAGWWGPAGFTNTFTEFELRPGGAWRYVMHAPDGTDFPLENRFLEVIPASRIVFRHPQPGHEFDMTISFTSMGDETEMTWRVVFDSAEECGRVRTYFLAANEQNFDRLEACLAAKADDMAGS